jgi:hypothetical protein
VELRLHVGQVLAERRLEALAVERHGPKLEHEVAQSRDRRGYGPVELVGRSR